jgi:hypothetical protein
VNDAEGTGIAGLQGATVGVAETTDEQRPRRGPNETVILLLFFIVSLAAVGLLLWREESRLLDDPAAKAQRGEITGATGDSLVREANFAKAIREIDDRLGPSDVINSVRLSPVRVDVTTRDEIGRQRILSVDPGFDVDTRDFGESEQPGVRARAIDTAAPQRFFATVQRRIRAPDESLDYLVYTVSGTPSWSLFLRDVPIAQKQWQADARGADVRRLGEPSSAAARQQACLQQADSAEEAARCQQ